MILNKQKKVRLATPPLQEFLRKTQRELNIASSEITIAFVSDAEIARWNQAYRKKKGPTDVLSFPATSAAGGKSPANKNSAKASEIPGHIATKGSAEPASRSACSYSPRVCPEPRRATRLPRPSGGHSPLFLGDIAIAPETAQRYAKQNGRSLNAEIRVLMLHGVLHLMGYDHENDTGQMNRIEQRLRRRLGIA